MNIKSKFNQLYNEARSIFEESEMNDENEMLDDIEQAPQDGDVSIPTQKPENNNQPEEPTPDDLENTVSQLPDPKAPEALSVDLLNTFLNFLRLPEDRKSEFLKSYDLDGLTANSDNYKEIVSNLKNIEKSDFPEPTFN